MESLEPVFDVAIIGTGLAQSIAAAALAQSGRRVIHLDANDYYGGRHASLSFQEVLDWAKLQETSEDPNIYSTVSYRFPASDDQSPSLSLHAASRQYAISLAPSVVPSSGNLIDALVGSGVSRYSAFRLLDVLGAVEGSSRAGPTLRLVPSSKEDIFKDQTLSLLAKRKLMKMLQYALGEYEDGTEWSAHSELASLDLLQTHFGLNSNIASAIVFSIAGSSSGDETANTSFPRLRRYMRSSGRYGSSPFLIGHYGGLGELAQGFCRACAVSGGTYILGRPIQSIKRLETSETGPESAHFSIDIEGVPSLIHATTILGLSSDGPEVTHSGKHIIRATLILDCPIPTVLTSQNPSIRDADSVFLSFPPGSIASGSAETAVFCLITGNGTMSCPKNQSLIYLSAVVNNNENSASAEDFMRPYVTFLTAGEVPSAPIFELFYRESDVSSSTNKFNAANEDMFVGIDDSPPLIASFTEIGDSSASRASAAFWKVSKLLTTKDSALPAGMWPERDVAEDEDLLE